MGIVIGEMAEVDECTIYQGVTLGGTSLVRGVPSATDAGARRDRRRQRLHPRRLHGRRGRARRLGRGGDQAGAAGATAVGNPARIIEAQADAAREEASARMGFSAYGVTQGDDPVAQAMKGLIDNASGHEHQIALLWRAIEKLSQRSRELPTPDCVPDRAHTTEQFDAEQLNRW